MLTGIPVNTKSAENFTQINSSNLFVRLVGRTLGSLSSCMRPCFSIWDSDRSLADRALNWAHKNTWETVEAKEGGGKTYRPISCRNSFRCFFFSHSRSSWCHQFYHEICIFSCFSFAIIFWNEFFLSTSNVNVNASVCFIVGVVINYAWVFIWTQNHLSCWRLATRK